MLRHLLTITAALAAATATATVTTRVNAAGADVIVGILDGTQVYARTGGIAALSVGTTSCNAGDKVLEWKRLPNNRHPIISMNMYRLADGRMEQIGQAWVKHGYTALQGNACNLRCRPNADNQALGIGCSDPYSTDLNTGPNLRARSEINPTTGFFDSTNMPQRPPPPRSPIDRGLQVAETDLQTPNARYFVEGHYVAPDDAEEGNAFNNAAHREVQVVPAAGGNFGFRHLGQTVREKSAIEAWEGAKLTRIDEIEAKVGVRDIKSRVVVAWRAVALGGVRHRYEYVVYNMNSNRGVGSFSVPIGQLQAGSIGFKAPRSHGEPWSNDPWTARVENGRLTWSTQGAGANPNANAIRWGTAYNFWFEADAAPRPATAQVGRFKPGVGVDPMPAAIEAPAGGN